MEAGVDRPRLDGGGRGVDVGVEGDDIQLDPRMRTVEVLQQHRRRDPSTVDVDAEGAPTGAHGSVGARFHPEQFPGVRQERLAVDRELGAARRAGEQPHVQILLQRGDALGHGLLRDRQRRGGVLELTGVRGGDEGTDGVEIHGPNPTHTTLVVARHRSRCLIPCPCPCFDRRGQRQVVNGRCGAWMARRSWVGDSDGCGRRTRSAPTARGWGSAPCR